MKNIFTAILASFALLAISAYPSFADTIVKRGTIKGVSVKWTTGSVQIVKTSSGHELRLGSNFKTKRGPALVVFLGNEKPSKRLGKLKAIEGSQTYKIPASVNINEFQKVFIHCVPFNATFGAGRLR